MTDKEADQIQRLYDVLDGVLDARRALSKSMSMLPALGTQFEEDVYMDLNDCWKELKEITDNIFQETDGLRQQARRR